MLFIIIASIVVKMERTNAFDYLDKNIIFYRQVVNHLKLVQGRNVYYTQHEQYKLLYRNFIVSMHPAIDYI